MTKNNWNIINVIKWTTDFFKKKDIENPKLDAEIIVSEILNIPKLELYLNFDKPLEKEELQKIKKHIIRRANREPLQYILGYTTFYGYKFFVNKDVLIPRPETELLIEIILKEIPSNSKILDIGTGSGAIAVTLKKERKDLIVFASDISEKALNIAKKNAKNLDITFIQSNIFDNINITQFDYIISNPPYISENDYLTLMPEILNYEPKIALTTTENGLSIYKGIIRQCNKYLKENGTLFFEIGYNQAKKIKETAIENNFLNIKIINDYNGFNRFLKINKNLH